MTAFQTPSLADTRVVDPVLSTVAQGYQSPTNVGSLLFPEVMVDARGGKVLEFGKEAFNVYNAVRAPGSATKRIEWGYKSTEYALKQEALEVKIPRERMQEAAIGVPNIDLASASIRMTMRSLQLGLELEQQHLVVDGGIPEILLAANGTDLWGHSSTPQNNPIEVVYEARETIRKKIGLYPNVMIMSPSAYQGLASSSIILDRLTYSENNTVTTDALAKLFDLERVVVGKAVYSEGEGGFNNVWWSDSNFLAILAYAPQSPAGMEEPSFGYTYTLRGNPAVESPYYDNPTKSWVYGVTYDRVAVVTAKDAAVVVKFVTA